MNRSSNRITKWRSRLGLLASSGSLVLTAFVDALAYDDSFHNPVCSRLLEYFASQAVTGLAAAAGLGAVMAFAKKAPGVALVLSVFSITVFEFREYLAFVSSCA